MARDIGIITEQGDLGFGFDKLNPNDNKVYTEAVKRENQDSTSRNQIINEEKK